MMNLHRRFQKIIQMQLKSLECCASSITLTYRGPNGNAIFAVDLCTLFDSGAFSRITSGRKRNNFQMIQTSSRIFIISRPYLGKHR